MSPAAARPQFASSRRLTITAATLVALSLAHAVISSPAQARDQAGVSSAVRGDVKRISQGDAVGVAVSSGDPIYRYDRITSGPDAGLQVMLLDETTLTIGPNSSITITEFVYDPSTGAGKVAAAIGNGFFRFVSGRVAHHNPADMTVSLPVATIGVRGTIVFGETTETGAIVGLAGPGGENNTGDKVAGVDVITRDGTAQLRRTGWGAIVIPGVAPVAQPLPLDTISRLLDAVAPRVTPPGHLPNATRAQLQLSPGSSASMLTGQTRALGSASGALTNGIQNADSALSQTTVAALQQPAPANANADSHRGPPAFH